ncbi:MAG: Arginine--tRNA ligase [Cyanobacteria bacterium RYN_339]|nr:Arginine--tRNA ligase [Cyanobacteria bacterium RYN_339]
MSLAARVEAAIAAAGLPTAEVCLDPPRHPGLGDLATPVAMAIARATGRPAMEVAEAIAAHLAGAIAAPPGFLNWTLPDLVLAAGPAVPPRAPRPFPPGLHTVQEARAWLMGPAAGPVSVVQAGRPVQRTWPELLALIGSEDLRCWLQLKPEAAPLALDLDLLAGETADNPAYYLRYSLMRARSIVTRASEEGLTPVYGPVEPAGRALAVALLRAPDELGRQPQRRVRFALDVAAAFHTYYATQRVFGAPQAPQRLALIAETARVLRCVLQEGLGLDAI